MKVADGKIIKGSIVTRARFPDGARVTVIQHDDRPPVKLTADETADVLQGLAEIDAGKGRPVEALRARLGRSRLKK
jgi:hypothetical protein